MDIDKKGYQYLTVRPRHKFGPYYPGHKFSYVKRRNLNVSSKFTEFLPRCSCRYKFPTWFTSLDMAKKVHTIHAQQEHIKAPTLEGL